MGAYKTLMAHCSNAGTQSVFSNRLSYLQKNSVIHKAEGMVQLT